MWLFTPNFPIAPSPLIRNQFQLPFSLTVSQTGIFSMFPAHFIDVMLRSCGACSFHMVPSPTLCHFSRCSRATALTVRTVMFFYLPPPPCLLCRAPFSLSRDFGLTLPFRRHPPLVTVFSHRSWRSTQILCPMTLIFSLSDITPTGLFFFLLTLRLRESHPRPPSLPFP